jgi:fatty-acyl-CoA synthase
VVPREGAQMTPDDILSHLRPRVAKIWMPDRVEFIDEVPKTSVGKFDKKVLRDRYQQPAEVASASTTTT